MACLEDHLELRNTICPSCKLQVDTYGNTEDQFVFCCFPDCGCDRSRNCMAGMRREFWSSKSKRKERGEIS